MKAIVIYESLYGNTATIARAIAEGLGQDTEVFSTAQVPAGVLGEIDLVVAGAPVHSLSLPTEKSRDWARTGNMGPNGIAPDLSHPSMRSWLSGLAKGSGCSAAFDTRVNAWYGRGAARKIQQTLKSAGYRPLVRPRGFYVSGHPIRPTTDGTLVEGELDRARAWGVSLAQTMEREIERTRS
jgi:flavodoxin